MTEELIRNYWNARARGYAIATVNDADPEDTRRWRGVLEDVLAPLEDKADVRILDVGCGPGLFSLLAAERLPNAHVTALDGSPAMLEELKASAEARGLLDRITLVEGDAGAIDEEGVYDLVMSRNVLWNLPDAEEALKGWWRALKTGGTLLTADGNHYRYLIDATHAAAVAAKPAPKSHAPKIFGNVDPAVMAERAKTLPLTRELRPDWDVRILEGVGASIASLSTSTTPAPDGSPVVTDFTLIAKKTA